jgi:hypothetical protein
MTPAWKDWYRIVPGLIKAMNALWRFEILGLVAPLRICTSQGYIGITNTGCLNSLMEYVGQKYRELQNEEKLAYLDSDTLYSRPHAVAPNARQHAASPSQMIDDSNTHSSLSAEGRNDSLSWLRPKVTLAVEGNISAGKSTFLKILEAHGLFNGGQLQVRQRSKPWPWLVARQ